MSSLYTVLKSNAMNTKILFDAIAIVAALSVTAIAGLATVTAPALAQDNMTGGGMTGGGMTGGGMTT
jgi:hypothetical protein